MSVKIEGVPDGYELVRIGCPKEGETYVDTSGRAKIASCAMNHAACWAIVRKIEPPYLERQAAWVKEHGLKIGDTVKALRMFGEQEDGFKHYANQAMKRFVGVKYKVTGITESAILIDDWNWPYFVLEKVVPVTRPMTRDEFLAAWKQRGFCPLIDDEGNCFPVTLRSGDLPVQVGDRSWHSLKSISTDYKFASDDSPISVTEN